MQLQLAPNHCESGNQIFISLTALTRTQSHSRHTRSLAQIYLRTCTHWKFQKKIKCRCFTKDTQPRRRNDSLAVCGCVTLPVSPLPTAASSFSPVFKPPIPVSHPDRAATAATQSQSVSAFGLVCVLALHVFLFLILLFTFL